MWWPQGNPSASPTFINLSGNSGSEQNLSVGYMDLDSNGNILFDYFANNASCYTGGYGAGEIENPTSASWSFVDLIPACSGPWAGQYYAGDANGVYVSHNGSLSTLNITSMSTRLIYRWVLPFTPSSTYTTLGPTRRNREGFGAPVSGAFGANEQYVVQGDYGWIDFGTVASNKWKLLSNVNSGWTKLWCRTYAIRQVST
jgi:hypothetical protein